eukprot:3526493-Pyramimonas_sp.AAC.1
MANEIAFMTLVEFNFNFRRYVLHLFSHCRDTSMSHLCTSLTHAGTLSTVIKEEGFRGLYRGLTPSLVALLPNWMIYFTVYEGMKKIWLPRVPVSEHGMNQHDVVCSCPKVASGLLLAPTTTVTSSDDCAL